MATRFNHSPTSSMNPEISREGSPVDEISPEETKRQDAEEVELKRGKWKQVPLPCGTIDVMDRRGDKTRSYRPNQSGSAGVASPKQSGRGCAGCGVGSSGSCHRRAETGASRGTYEIPPTRFRESGGQKSEAGGRELQDGRWRKGFALSKDYVHKLDRQEMPDCRLVTESVMRTKEEK